MVSLYKNKFMGHALKQAEFAIKENEVPVGAAIVRNDGIISTNFNRMRSEYDPTAHAEILCIREATKKLQTANLSDCEIYITLEPCAMCAQAIAFSKIKRVYFGAYDEKFGAIENGVRLFNSKTHNHVPEIYGGIEQQKATSLMKSFFTKIRKKV